MLRLIREKYFKDLYDYSAEYYRLLGNKAFLYLLSMIAPAFLDGIGISMIVPLLNLVMSNSPVQADVMGNQNIAYELLMMLGLPITLGSVLLFIISIYVFKFLITFLNFVFRSSLTSIVLKKTRLRLYTQITEMEYLSFQNRSTGFYSNLAGVQLNQYINGFTYLILFFSALISALSYLGFSFFVDFKFSLLACVCGGLFALIFAGLSKKMKELSIKNTNNESRITAFFIEAVQAFKYLKATANYPVFLKRLGTEIELIRQQTVKSERIGGFFIAISEPLVIFLICFFIYIQVTVLGHSMTGMLLSIFLFHRALTNVTATQKAWQVMMNYSGGIQAVSAYMKESQAKAEKSGTTQLTGPIREVRFDHVTFAYGSDRNAIQDLSLTIRQNTTVAFVGQSGAGKTTIVDLITLLNKPVSGDIYVNGISTRDLDIQSFRKQIGLVTQEVNLFDESVANNVSLWRDSDPKKIQDAITDAYAGEFIRKLPEGIETKIGDRGLRLSGGQKQRLSLARELYKKPSLLILDEATSALDSESESFIKETLDSLKGKLTIVMIAHRLSTVKEADTIVVLKDGEIQDSGTFEELVERDEYFRKIVHLQKV